MLSKKLNELVTREHRAAKDKTAFLNDLRVLTHSLSEQRQHPVGCVLWLPVGQVHANAYNPNVVAGNEMKLLKLSIESDGYTQPVVAVKEADGKRCIVDGFHRYSVMRACPDIAATTGGMLPVVTIDRPEADRMASTIRHNRARGKHSLQGMGNLILKLLVQGWEDAKIQQELGIEADELVRTKHLTGFSKLFANAEYRRAWTTPEQIKFKKLYGTENNTDQD